MKEIRNSFWAEGKNWWDWDPKRALLVKRTYPTLNDRGFTIFLLKLFGIPKVRAFL